MAKQYVNKCAYIMHPAKGVCRTIVPGSCLCLLQQSTAFVRVSFSEGGLGAGPRECLGGPAWTRAQLQRTEEDRTGGPWGHVLPLALVHFAAVAWELEEEQQQHTDRRVNTSLGPRLHAWWG